MEQAKLIARLDALIKADTGTGRSRTNIATDIAAAYRNEVGAAVPLAIIAELDQAYQKDGLLALAKQARPLVLRHRDQLDKLSLNLPYSLLATSDYAGFSKARLVWAVAFLFSHAEVFRLFRAALTVPVQQAIERLTWVPRMSAEVLGQAIGQPMTDRAGRTYFQSGTVSLKAEFKLLPHKGEGWGGTVMLEWPVTIRQFLQTVYPQPANYRVQTSPEPPADLLRWDEGEVIIFEEIQRLLAYRMQNSIVVNNSGKVAATGMKKMRKLLGLREFFPEGGFPLVRTAVLAQLFSSYKPAKDSLNIDTLGLLRQLRHAFERPFKTLFLLNDLKNHGYIQFYQYHQNAETALTDWMGRLPVGEWVSTENILSYAQMHDLTVQPCSPGEYVSLAYETESPWRTGQTVKENVSKANAYLFVERPALLGGLFLFAALGWLDVAYEVPLGKFGKDYYSAYDGLRYVRLNALGAALFDRTAGPYVPKVNTATQELRFDEQSLLIFCDPEHVVAETILANYAERVSPTRFRVSAETFLNGCKTKAQLLAKISLFCTSVAPSLPANWQVFFDELTDKADPLTLVTKMTTYGIAPTNQPLIRVLAQDAVLKTMVVKAEGFRILVADDQLTRFKNRLRELGYLVP